MWVFFNDGFVSVVQDENNPDRLIVRARRPDVLRALFPAAEVITTDTSDYRYRSFVPKAAFAQALAERVSEIEYGNFKASVKDHDLAALYMQIWSIGLDYQR